MKNPYLREFCEVFDGPHATPTKTDEGPFYLSISSLENGKLSHQVSTPQRERFQEMDKKSNPEKRRPPVFA